MRVPWTARRSKQSILKEISPGISLEGMMLKLKLQYFGHLMRRVDSLERTLIPSHPAPILNSSGRFSLALSYRSRQWESTHQAPEVPNTGKSGEPRSVAWSQAGKAESWGCWKLFKESKTATLTGWGTYVTLTPALVCSRAGKDRPSCVPSAASSSKSVECFPRDCRATWPNSCRSR